MLNVESSAPKIEYGFLPDFFYSSKKVYENILCELLNKSSYFADGKFHLIENQSKGEPDVINDKTAYSLDFKLMISQSFAELQKIIKKTGGTVSLKKKPEIVFMLNACRNMNSTKLKDYNKRNDVLSKTVSHFFEKNLNVSKNLLLFIPLFITTVDSALSKEEQFELIHREFSETLNYIHSYRVDTQKTFETFIVYIVNIHNTAYFTFVVSKFTDNGLKTIDKVDMFSLESVLDVAVENMGDKKIKALYDNYKVRKIK